MRVVRHFSTATLPPSAIAIGNFDGLHLGHRALLDGLRQEAHKRNLASAVLTFEPHPRELFTPLTAPTRLTSLREKVELLRASGIDYLLVQRFSAPFAALDALTFRDKILVEQLQARLIAVGDDFRFGRQRQGDATLLAAHPQLDVMTLDEISADGLRISSTAVREALQRGELSLASRLLGRTYSISGRVMHGEKLGRQLGFPTANVQMKHNRPPLQGVFVVEVLLGAVRLQGVASLGFRPTIHGGDARASLEVHLFDFAGDLYGQHMQVEFLHKLRDEEKYSGLQALIDQIAADCVAARDWFAIHRSDLSH